METLRAAAGAFWSGLVAWTPASTLAVIGFAVAEFVVWGAVLSQRTVAELPPGWLMETPRDDYARITVDALNLRYCPKPGLIVGYAGSSVARMAIRNAEDPTPLGEELTALVGEPVNVYPLFGDGLAVEESYMTLDQFPDDSRGVFLLMLSDRNDDDVNRRLAKKGGGAFVRLALYSPSTFDDRVSWGETPPTSGLYFFDFLKFFASRRNVLARFGPVLMNPLVKGKNDPDMPFVDEHFWWEVGRQADQAGPEPPLMNHLELVERMARSAEKKGLTLVLLEAPLNPRYEALKQEVRNNYEVGIRNFAREVGIRYWDFNPEAPLTTADFGDHIHVRSMAARDRWQRVLTGRLAALLKESAASPDRPERK